MKTTRAVSKHPRSRLSASARRASIVAAATELFAEAGYQRATMGEVARRVGVSEPVIFQNFGSKAAVFAAVIDEAVDRGAAMMRQWAAAHGSIGDWLADLLGPEHLSHMHGRGGIGVLFADAMSVSTDPQVKKAMRRAHGRIARTLADLIARGQDDGSVRDDIDAETCAWWLLSIFASHGFRATMPDRKRLEAELGALTLRLLTTDGKSRRR